MAKISKEEEVALFEQVVKDLPIDLDVAMRFFKIQKEKDGSPKMVNGKPKIDGKQLALKLKETDAYSPTLLAWIEAQNNFTDSIKYLMEKEIITSGVRDLSQHIPRVRDLEKSIVEYNNNQYKEQVSAYQDYSIPRDTNIQRHQPIPRDTSRELGAYQQQGYTPNAKQEYTVPQAETSITHGQIEQKQEQEKPKDVAVETAENVEQAISEETSTQNLNNDSVIKPNQVAPESTVKEEQKEVSNEQDEDKVLAETVKKEVPPVKKKVTKNEYPGW